MRGVTADLVFVCSTVVNLAGVVVAGKNPGKSP